MLGRSSINPNQWFRHNWQNRLQTAVLLLFLGGYLLLLSWLIWGSAAATWLLVVGGSLLLLLPSGSPHLLMKFYQARPLSRMQAAEHYRLLEDLARRADLPVLPVLYYLPTREPNALAVGSRDEPIIAVSDGLLRLLTPRELAGVLAHEISHLRNDDLRVMRFADLVSRLTNSLSLLGQILLLLNLPLVVFADQSINWLLVLILIFAPQISMLAQLGLSRVREFSADLGAATLTGDPEGLASALQKIQHQTNGLFRRLLTGNAVPHWLRTHPPTRERIRRLMELTQRHSKFSGLPEQVLYGQRACPAAARVIQLPNDRGFSRFLYPDTGRGHKVIYRTRGFYEC